MSEHTSTHTTTLTPDEVFFADPATLAVHPLLAVMPPVTREDAETEGFIETVRQSGRIDIAIILDEEGRIMDGRRRRLAAATLGLPLPAVRRPSSEAATIVLNALAGRRNLTKGALAYLSLPLLQPAIEEARRRWVAALQTGTAGTKSNSVGFGQKTLAQIAADLGFSDELLRQATKVRDLLNDPTVYTWGEAAQEATRRGWFEPKLFAGEIGLGGIIQAIAGKTATDGQARVVPPVAELFQRDFSSVGKRFTAKWETLSPEERRPVVKAVADEVTTWPEDVQRALLTSLKSALKAGPEPKF
ncbi:hypothetical protein [Geminisphaera colitermitum]|uniref:hypothetical protein n=1 Tax=Geminisphaera colitermitum TaxID=1148786 RepID=UPI0001964DF2|nr:hypothetical protein [Geminisphaera colitermitum]